MGETAGKWGVMAVWWAVLDTEEQLVFGPARGINFGQRIISTGHWTFSDVLMTINRPLLYSLQNPLTNV